MHLLLNEVNTTWRHHYPQGNVAGFMQDLGLTPVLGRDYRCDSACYREVEGPRPAHLILCGTLPFASLLSEQDLGLSPVPGQKDRCIAGSQGQGWTPDSVWARKPLCNLMWGC